MPRGLLCVPYLFVIVEYKERLVDLGEVIKRSILILIIIIISNILIEFYTFEYIRCHFNSYDYPVEHIISSIFFFLNMRKYVQRRRLNDLVKVILGK